MYEEIIKYAKQKGFKKLTLNTYKNKFPSMYTFCLKNGFEEYRTEKEKSFFIKSV
jgi:GNAT superfamily N-acetyltransferase